MKFEIIKLTLKVLTCLVISLIVSRVSAQSDGVFAALGSTAPISPISIPSSSNL